MNQDINMVINEFYKLNPLCNISIITVNEQTMPQYPKNCDVIDAWSYSCKTPKAPIEYFIYFNNLLNDKSRFNIEKDVFRKNVEFFLKQLDKYLEDYVLDNFFFVLRNSLKRIHIPDNYITIFE